MFLTTQSKQLPEQWFHQYLSKLDKNSILHQCQLVEITDLTQYNRFVGNNKSQSLKHLPKSQWIWGLVRQSDQQLLSTLHLTYIYSIVEWDSNKPQHILQWSYAFTRVDPLIRRQGLSKTLRLASMSLAKRQGYDYINSVPFTDAYSIGILRQFGFDECGDCYIYDLKNER